MSIRVSCLDCNPNFSTVLPGPNYPPPWGGSGTLPPIDPTILAVTCPTIPSTAVVGAATTIRVLGQNFTNTCQVFLDNVGQTTTFVSATELTFQATGTIAKTSTITVKDGAATAQGTCQFVWTAAAILTMVCPVSPASAAVGSASLPVTVNGTLFNAGCEVLLDGVPQVTTYVSPTQLRFTVNPAAETVRTAVVGVRDPVAGTQAVQTCPFDFTILVLQPTLTSIFPDYVGRNDPPELLTVTGTNFDATSVIMRGGLAMPTTLVNATTLTAMTNPATASTGLFEMRVRNGTGSTAKTSNPVEGMCVANPVLLTLTPNTAPGGGAAVPVELLGTGFGDTVEVLIDNVGIASTRVNSGVIHFSVPAAAAGVTKQITVRLGHQHGGAHDDVRVLAAPTSLPFTFS